jgi:hypothetical protein
MVAVQGQANLFEIVLAFCSVGCLPDALHRRD